MPSFKKVALCFVLGILAGCSSHAPMEPSASDSAKEPSKTSPDTIVAQNNANPEEQVICKLRTITGSRFKQKTCMTAKEWKTMSSESKGVVDKATRNKVRYTN